MAFTRLEHKSAGRVLGNALVRGRAFQGNVWRTVLGLPHGLSEKTLRGPWLLIELRICSDSRAASFICLIIVVEGGDEGGGREWRGMALRFHSKKSGS